MDNKTAIGWLREIKDKYIHGGDEEWDKKRKEAIDYTIKVLEQKGERMDVSDLLIKLLNKVKENPEILHYNLINEDGGDITYISTYMRSDGIECILIG